MKELVCIDSFVSDVAQQSFPCLGSLPRLVRGRELTGSLRLYVPFSKMKSAGPE